jgi:hypothetical protein
MVIARAVASRGLTISIDLVSDDGTTILRSSPKVAVPAEKKVTSDEIVIEGNGELSPGWYRLNLRLESTTDGVLEGLVVYAE